MPNNNKTRRRRRFNYVTWQTITKYIQHYNDNRLIVEQGNPWAIVDSRFRLRVQPRCVFAVRIDEL